MLSITPEELVGQTIALFDGRQESAWFGFRAGPCIAVDNGPRKGFRRLCLLLGPAGAKSRVWFSAESLLNPGGQPAGVCRGPEIVPVMVDARPAKAKSRRAKEGKQ